MLKDAYTFGNLFQSYIFLKDCSPVNEAVGTIKLF